MLDNAAMESFFSSMKLSDDLSKKQSGGEIVTYFTTDGCRTFLHWIGCMEQFCKNHPALGQAHAIRHLIQYKDNEYQGS